MTNSTDPDQLAEAVCKNVAYLRPAGPGLVCGSELDTVETVQVNSNIYLLQEKI